MSSVQQQQHFPDPQFEIFDWHSDFRSCLRYFVQHAQFSGPVQTVASFVNIQLPFQTGSGTHTPAGPSVAPAAVAPGPSSSSASSRPPPGPYVSLVPYVRRLVVTGFDTPAVLQGFFGDDWARGVGPIHETERRNYLFAAKSESWLAVKGQYDMGNGQTVPFLRPLQNATEQEIKTAEASWSEWLAMQDWMLGPRAPQNNVDDDTVNVKREAD